MCNLQVFSNDNFGEVRAVEINGEPWFVLKDVCNVLGIKNPTQTANQLDDDEVSMLDIGLKNGVKVNIINESGLYSVILRSDKPNARPFRKWVTSEVLPSIRKTGAYVATPKTYIEALEALIAAEKEKERLSLQLEDKSLELDESMNWYTVKRVAKLNKISWQKLNWRKLKNTSNYLAYEVKKIFDANYGMVNAYHIEVWQQEYPELLYN